MNQYLQQTVNEQLLTPGILFLTGLVPIYGLNEAILLSQLLYWCDRATLPGGWVYKTMIELKYETGLTRTKQDSAIKKLKSLGIIETKLGQIPAKRHFRINEDNLLTSLQDFSNLDYFFDNGNDVENTQSITETTTKTTPKITTQTKKTLDSYEPNGLKPGDDNDFPKT